MEISGVIEQSVVNGTNVRYVVFTQGCLHSCKGCHNPETWALGFGEEKSIQEIMADIKNYPRTHLTISGGEPLLQDVEVLKLAKEFKKQYPDRTIWLYTGFDFDVIKNDFEELFSYIDVVVDGKFEIDLKDPDLDFRGSSNQRIINLREEL